MASPRLLDFRKGAAFRSPSRCPRHFRFNLDTGHSSDGPDQQWANKRHRNLIGASAADRDYGTGRDRSRRFCQGAGGAPAPPAPAVPAVPGRAP